MGKARFPYGRALGHRNHFIMPAKGTGAGMAAVGTANNISGTATPNLTTGDLFYANNTASLAITAFTHQLQGGVEGCEEGRLVRLFFLDTATSLTGSSYIKLAGTGNFGGTGVANSTIELMYSRSAWYELSRSPNTEQSYINVNMSGTTNCSVDANNVQTVIVTQTGAATQLSAISGGYIGQHLTIVFANTLGSAITMTTGGNITFANTAGIAVINTGGAVTFVKANATTWYATKGPVSKLG